MKHFRSHIIVLTFVALGMLLGGMLVDHKITERTHAADTSEATFTVTNSAPSFTVGPYEEWNDSGGDFWFDQTSGTTETIEDVYFLDANTGYAAGHNGTILKTTDGGRNWTDVGVGSGNFKDIYCATADLCWAVGEFGLSYRTVNGGDNWVNWAPGYPGWIYDIHFIDSTCQSGLSGCTGWFVNSGSYIRKTTDGGDSWVTQTETFTEYVVSVYCTDDQTCWASDWVGNIARTTNGGSNWSMQSTPVSSGILQIQFIDSTCSGGMAGCTGWAVGYSSILLKTTDGGGTWSQMTTGYPSSYYDVFFLDVNNGWIPDASGRILKTTDGGTNWSLQSPDHSGLYALHMADATHGWAVGTSGTILSAGDTVTESSDISPTHDGTAINFKATATDINSDNYYLIICKNSSAPTPSGGTGDAPECNGGATNRWGTGSEGVSTVTTGGAEATVTYTTGTVDETGCTSDESCPWYAFVCDASNCSAADSGTGSSGSPFVINHAGTFGTVTVTDAGELITNGDMELDSNWSTYNTPTTNEQSTEEVHGGTYSRKGIATFPNGFLQGVSLVAGKEYRYSFWHKGDPIKYLVTNATWIDVGTNADWTQVTGTAVANGVNNTFIFSGSTGGPHTFYIDDVSLVPVEINPGDTLRFILPQANIADADTSGSQDTIDMYICTDATTGFNNSTNTCTGGSLICSDTSVDPTSEDASCNESGNTLVPGTDTHSTENFKVYVEDGHSFPGTGTNNQSYDIANTAPTHGTPEMDIHAPTLPNSVGYWQFEDGDSATSFDDETSNANNGSCSNCPDWTEAGYSGGGYDFNGTDDSIELGSDPVFSNSSFSVSAWFKPDNPTYQQNVFSHNGASNDSQIQFQINSSGQLNANVNIYGVGGSTLVADQWVNAVVTYNGDQMILYENGDLKGSQSSVPYTPSNGPLIIGKDEAASKYFDGIIDEFHIYDRALTLTEIQAIYNAYTTPGTTAYTDSNMDLSCKTSTVDDHDSDTTTTIFNWEKDSTSIAVLNMPFDSNITSTTADVVLDYSSNANHGTLSGASPTWSASGAKGGAYDFNGTDDYVDIGDTSDVDFGAADFTLEAWIKTNSTAVRQMIIGKDSDVNGSQFIFLINPGGVGDIGITYYAPSGGGFARTVTGVIDTNWHHVVGLRRGDDMEIWIDGVENAYALQGGTPGTMNSNITPLTIGYRPYAGFNDYFDGLIDEVRIYDSALSSDQIFQNYNNGKPLYNTIVNQEIAEGDDSWQCKATINDAQTENQDSITNSSNTIDPSNSEPVHGFPSTRAHALLDSNSVGYWQFEDGDSMTTFDDETTNNNNGSCSNCPAFTEEGAIGGGYEFDGVNDFITANSYDLSAGGTVSLWFNVERITDTQTLFHTSNGSTNRLDIQINSSHIRANFWEGTNHSKSTSFIYPNQWMHAVYVWTGSEAILYIDGVVPSGSALIASGDFTDNTVIGSRGSTAAEYFNGSIDEVHVYDRALSATEIANLYNSDAYVYSNYDLGASARDMTDADSDSTYATVDWRESDVSAAVLNMSFNETVTSTTTDAVNDYSSYGNDGTLGGGTAGYVPTWTNAAGCANYAGGCYDFDGTDNYIEVAHSADLDITGAITMEGWVNLDSLAGQSLLMLKGDANASYTLTSYGLLIDASGKIKIILYTPSTGLFQSTNVLINTGQWHHIVATWDGTTINSDNVKLYVDGALEQTFTKTNGLNSTSESLVIGTMKPASFNAPTDGKIDEVRIYDTVLTLEQIQANYNVGKPNYQNLVSEGTAVGESWKATMTIGEGNSESSTTIESNEVEILGLIADVAESWDNSSTGGGTEAESSTSLPTHAGLDVDFKGTFNTAGSQYYLAVCKTDEITAGNDMAPSCAEGDWGTAELIETDNAGNAQYSQIASDPSGNMIAVWEQSDGTRTNIWANRYTFSTGLWDTAELIETDNAGSAIRPQIASDPSGNMIAVWQQDDGTWYNIVANRYTFGSGWGTAELIETNTGGAIYPQIASDPSGNMIAIWGQHDGTRYNVWANRYTSGVGWGTAELIESNSGTAIGFQIASDSSGNMNAVWQHLSGGKNSVYANRYTFSTGLWGTAELIETDSGGTLSPQIASDPSGNMIAVWEQTDGTRMNIWANRYTFSTGLWGTAELIETDTGSAALPQIASDPYGNMMAVWNQHDGTRKNIWSNRYTFGVGWGTEELIETDNAGFAISPQIASDSSGNAIAVWRQDDGTRYNIVANRYTFGSGWGTAELIETDNLGGASYSEIASDPSGNMIAVWQQNDGTRDNIWANRYTSDTWAISPATNDGVQATASYTTSSGDSVSNVWYAFACDKVASTATCSVSTQGSGNSGSPFVVNHQPTLVQYSFSATDTTLSEETIEIVTDEDMEAGDTSAWTAVNDAVLTKSTASPHGGAQALRIQRNVTINARADQTILTVGKTYRITGWARGDGLAHPRFYGGKNNKIWSGDSSSTWQYFDETHVADASANLILMTIGEDTQWTEWDDISIHEVGLAEPGDQLRFEFEAEDTNNDNLTTVVCDTSGFTESTQSCTVEELCRSGMVRESQDGAGSTYLYDVFFVDSQMGWAVGASGTILKTTDGGDNWIAQTSNVSTQLNGVYFIDSQTGWVVGNTGTIVITTDGGSSWVDKTSVSGTTQNFNDVHFIDANTGWAVANNDVIRKTTDGGLSWSSQTSTLPKPVLSVHFIDSQTGWATLGESGGTIAKTINGGTTWTWNWLQTNNYNDVYFIDANTGWAVGVGGIIRKSTDGGDNWTAQTSPTVNRLNRVFFTDANNGWAVGNSGTVISTTDGGENWSSETVGVRILRSAYFIDGYTGWVVGDSGTIYEGVDGANDISKWNSQTSNTSNYLFDVHFIDEYTGWTVGNSSDIRATTDGGLTWATQTSPIGSSLWATHFADANTGWAVGGSGRIINTTNGGTSWAEQTSTTANELHDINCIDENTCWATGLTGTIVKTTNGGSNWAAQTSGTTNTLRGVHFIDKDTGWIVSNGVGTGGVNSNIKKTTSGGASWTGQTSGVSVTLYDASFIDENTGWAVGGSGTIVNTTDGGSNWSTQTTWTSETLYGVHFDDANYGWAVGANGTVLYTTDGGINWLSMVSGTTLDLWGVHSVNKNISFTTGQGGTILKGTGTRYCDETDSDPNDNDTNPVYIGIPEPHGDKSYTVHTFDEHNFTDDGTYETQNLIEVEDVEPTLISYTTADTPNPAAGDRLTGDPVDFSAVIQDDNGEADITAVEGYFYDTDSEELSDGACTLDDNDCYLDSTCTLNTDYDNTLNVQLQAQCQINFFYNANASTAWKAHVNPTDGNGKATDFTDSDAVVNAALLGIEVDSGTSVGYSEVAVGGVSGGVEVSLGNVGNQDIDILVEGTDMCIDTYEETCSGEYIPKANQKWHHSTEDFDFGGAATGDGPYTLVETAGATGGTTGCINHTLRGRADKTATTQTNQSIFWKLKIPSTQQSGSYYGQLTLASTAECTPEICDNSTDDDGDGRIDCSDFKDCDVNPACTVLTVPMRSVDHETSTDLLTNGDMETGNPPTGWTISSDASGIAVLDEATGGGGKQSFELKKGSTNTILAYQPVSTVVGNWYRYSGWVKNLDATNVKITKYDDDWSDSVASTTVTANSWTYVSVEFEATDTTTRLALEMSGSLNEKGRWDGLSVIEINQLQDGNMEKTGFDDWAGINSAIVEKVTGTPQEGARAIRVTRNGVTSAFIKPTVPVLSADQHYHLTGYARSDGNAAPRITQGTSGTQVTVWTGGTTGSWEYFDLTFTAGGDELRFITVSTLDPEYVEWDDVRLKKLDGTVDLSDNELHAIFGDGVDRQTFPIKLKKPGYSFDGVDQYMEVFDHNSLDTGAGDFSFTAWIKTPASWWSSPVYRPIFDKSSGSAWGNGSDADGYGLAIGNDGRLVGVYDGIGDNTTLNTAAATLALDTWYHITLVYQTGVGGKIYVNGTEEGSTSTVSGDNSNTRNMIIGDTTTANRKFAGVITDLKFFDSALPSQRVKDLYYELLSKFK